MERKNLHLVKRASINFKGIQVFVKYIQGGNTIYIITYDTNNQEDLNEMFTTTKHIHKKGSLNSLLAGYIKAGEFVPLDNYKTIFENEEFYIERDPVENTVMILIHDKNFSFTSMLMNNKSRFIRRLKRLPKKIF